MGTLLAHLLVAYITLAAPWVGRFKYRQLQRQIAAQTEGARGRFYRLAVLQQIARIAVVLLICLLDGVQPVALGLTKPNSWQTTVASLGGLLLVVIVSTVWFRHRGDKQLRRLQKSIGALIPTSASERIWFSLIGFNAGISEELVFRGFLFYYLRTYTPIVDVAWMLVITSAVFAFCHLYQGMRGVFLTGLFGVCAGMLYLGSGSLLLPMAVHAMVDLRLVFILTPRRLQLLQQSKAAAAGATT